MLPLHPWACYVSTLCFCVLLCEWDHVEPTSWAPQGSNGNHFPFPCAQEAQGQSIGQTQEEATSTKALDSVPTSLLGG